MRSGWPGHTPRRASRTRSSGRPTPTARHESRPRWTAWTSRSSNGCAAGRKLVVPGDGTALWTMTHADDFAVGLGGPAWATRLRSARPSTSPPTRSLTWNELTETIATLAGFEPELVHVPSDFIAGIDSDLGQELLNDRAHSLVFDNSKVKGLVPEFEAKVSFAEGIARSLKWFGGEPSLQAFSEERIELLDRVVDAYERLGLAREDEAAREGRVRGLGDRLRGLGDRRRRWGNLRRQRVDGRDGRGGRRGRHVLRHRRRLRRRPLRTADRSAASPPNRAPCRCDEVRAPRAAGGRRYSYENLREWLERSRENLGVETVDLVQLHCPPWDAYYTPSVFEACDRLVEEGLAGAYGVSVEKVEEALKAIEYPGVATVQIIFNIFRQRPAELFFEQARCRDVGVIVRVRWPRVSCRAASDRRIDVRRRRPSHLQPPRRGIRRRRDVLRRRLGHRPRGRRGAAAVRARRRDPRAIRAPLDSRIPGGLDRDPGCETPAQAVDNAGAADLPRSPTIARRPSPSSTASGSRRCAPALVTAAGDRLASRASARSPAPAASSPIPR